MYTVLSDVLVKQDGPSYERLSFYVPFRLRGDTGFATYFFILFLFFRLTSNIYHARNWEPRDR